VVLMDTSFSTGLAQILNNPFPDNKERERILRQLLESPPSPDSIIYIVSRSDLAKGQRPAMNEPEVKVVVRKVVIPLEASHFLVDYDNPDDKITLHISHICAWDVAEWLRTYDLSAYPPHDPVSSPWPGMELNLMDISRLGRYVIDGKSQEEAPVESKVISDRRYTWGPSLYTYLDRLPSSGMTPGKLDNIYWSSFGLWKDLMTQFMCYLFRDYKYQQVPQSNMLSLAEQGIPPCLLRLQTCSMEIADQYVFDPGYMVSSPQFMPRRGNQGSSTDGYITCNVFTPERNEIWIFKADALSKGAICKLYHESVNFAFTLHTTWLPKIEPRLAEYKIYLKEDYEDLAKNFQSPPEFEKEIQELFAQELYPRFERE
jgi:Retinal pigment epithelial membrane protein